MSNKSKNTNVKAEAKVSNSVETKVATPAAPPTNTSYKCTVCDHEFETPKAENVRCPLCRAMALVRLHPKRENYTTGLGVTVSGRDTVDIGDLVATFLRGLSPEDVIDVTADYLDMLHVKLAFSPKMRKQRIQWAGTTAEWLTAKYEGRNEGMIRMNCGNVLRGALNRIDPTA
jgi:DNA-directed RNA polymerase subunit RPC12/RpoP